MFTGTQAGDVSCAVCEQASRDDGCGGDDAVKLGEREQESDTECGDVAWTGDACLNLHPRGEKPSALVMSFVLEENGLFMSAFVEARLQFLYFC